MPMSRRTAPPTCISSPCNLLVISSDLITYCDLTPVSSTERRSHLRSAAASQYIGGSTYLDCDDIGPGCRQPPLKLLGTVSRLIFVIPVFLVSGRNSEPTSYLIIFLDVSVQTLSCHYSVIMLAAFETYFRNTFNYKYYLITDENKFEIQSVDELDLEDFKHGGANITGFRLVDPSSDRVKDSLKDWMKMIAPLASNSTALKILRSRDRDRAIPVGVYFTDIPPNHIPKTKPLNFSPSFLLFYFFVCQLFLEFYAYCIYPPFLYLVSL